jgi:hypothetical protein
MNTADPSGGYLPPSPRAIFRAGEDNFYREKEREYYISRLIIAVFSANNINEVQI